MKSQKTLWILLVAGFCFWSGLAITLPTLPLYIQSLGGTPHQVGIVMGGFAIGLIASRAWLGKLADRNGRKRVLLIGLGVAVLAPLTYLLDFFFFHSLPLMFTLRGIHGISIAAFTTGYVALIVDIAPPEHRGQILGYTSLVHPMGVALGPSLGSWLEAEAGHGWVFLAATVFGLAGLVCVLYVRECPPSSAQAENSGLFWRLLGAGRLRIPTLVMLLVGLAFGTLSTFVPLFIKAENIDFSPGLFYSAAALASFIGRVATGSASDRWGRGVFISLSLLFYTASMVGLSQAQTGVDLLVAGFLEGFGGGVLIPMMSALMADRSQPDERGRVLSLTMGGFDFGIAIAGPIIGALAADWGLRTLFACGGGFTILALGLFFSGSGLKVADSCRFAVGRGPDPYAVPMPVEN
ncbi:MFS transporter [Synechococcus sp. PCC 6312]|uniref:MFS transporter n=1 Tax=Synechococcus sp. (strain ATCC 27167 / PCC 6312) TaxID=195253 RepID=UPI00029F49A6|nr:MFS transporter [Synechococcus sp. PCC 6312]AFY59631.1 arabinose efflux permease family protein [Synechococcus sp. PCC 6312]